MDYDVRKDIYSAVDTIQLDDVRKFHKDRFANKTWTMQLIGSRDKIDFEALKPYGKVVELSLKDIFGYEVEKEIKPWLAKKLK